MSKHAGVYAPGRIEGRERVYCPECGAEYRPEVRRWVDCDVDLAPDALFPAGQTLNARCPWPVAWDLGVSVLRTVVVLLLFPASHAWYRRGPTVDLTGGPP